MSIQTLKKLFLSGFLTLACTVFANSDGHEEGHPTPLTEGIADGSKPAPRLEIRKYRFSHKQAQKFERLVLEFDRKDFYQDAKPRVHSRALTSRELSVNVEDALLLGAIPESLINESYASKSKYLGPIAVNVDSPAGGFSLNAKLKESDLEYEAFWLSKPERLILDVFPKGSKRGKQGLAAGGHSGPRNPQSLSVKHHDRAPGPGDFLCFPSRAKVDLTVRFQPGAEKKEEATNFRVNTDGSNVGLGSAVDQEAVVCYPKASQVKATLSFLQTGQASAGEAAAATSGGNVPAQPSATPPLFNLGGGTAPAAAGHTATPPTASTTPTAPTPVGSDSDLEPPGAAGGKAGSQGLFPPLGGAQRGTASGGGPGALLPPIGN